jgi:DNA repair photolyase
MEFEADRNGTGTKEWADISENIVRGCANGCIYCYAAHKADSFDLKPRDEWTKEEFTKRANLTSYPHKDGVIMFPTAHDITPFNLETYLRVVKLMLASNNNVLIVSKPRFECIKRLVDELTEYKSNILFRFTICSTSPTVIEYWEPGAPKIEERIESLKYAFKNGYRTSVSAEPLLGGLGTAYDIEAVVDRYVTDTIWIGKLNKPRIRVPMNDPSCINAVTYIESEQTDEKILAIYNGLKNNPKIRWKDSIKEAMARNGITI